MKYMHHEAFRQSEEDSHFSCCSIIVDTLHPPVMWGIIPPGGGESYPYFFIGFV